FPKKEAVQRGKGYTETNSDRAELLLRAPITRFRRCNIKTAPYNGTTRSFFASHRLSVPFSFLQERVTTVAKPHSHGLVVELLETRSLLNGALTPAMGHAEPGPELIHISESAAPEHSTAPSIDYGAHQARDTAPAVQLNPVNHDLRLQDVGVRDSTIPADWV